MVHNLNEYVFFHPGPVNVAFLQVSTEGDFMGLFQCQKCATFLHEAISHLKLCNLSEQIAPQFAIEKNAMC